MLSFHHFTRLAARETKAANSAVTDSARQRHLQMAAQYSARADRLKESKPLTQVGPRQSFHTDPDSQSVGKSLRAAFPLPEPGRFDELLPAIDELDSVARSKA